MADGGGFEPPVPFGTHALQACTINRSVTHPKESSSASESYSPLGESYRVRLRLSGRGRVSQLQATEQFVERQLKADVKFAEVCVLGADRVETHFVNDCLDLKCVPRK
jgi:hypothetical protein